MGTNKKYQSVARLVMETQCTEEEAERALEQTHWNFLSAVEIIRQKQEKNEYYSGGSSSGMSVFGKDDSFQKLRTHAVSPDASYEIEIVIYKNGYLVNEDFYEKHSREAAEIKESLQKGRIPQVLVESLSGKEDSINVGLTNKGSETYCAPAAKKEEDYRTIGTASRDSFPVLPKRLEAGGTDVAVMLKVRIGAAQNVTVCGSADTAFGDVHSLVAQHGDSRFVFFDARDGCEIGAHTRLAEYDGRAIELRRRHARN